MGGDEEFASEKVQEFARLPNIEKQKSSIYSSIAILSFLYLLVVLSLELAVVIDFMTFEFQPWPYGSGAGHEKIVVG